MAGLFPSRNCPPVGEDHSTSVQAANPAGGAVLCGCNVPKLPGAGTSVTLCSTSMPSRHDNTTDQGSNASRPQSSGSSARERISTSSNPRCCIASAIIGPAVSDGTRTARCRDPLLN